MTNKRVNGVEVPLTDEEEAEFERRQAEPPRPRKKTQLEKLADLLVTEGLLTQEQIDAIEN